MISDTPVPSQATCEFDEEALYLVWEGESSSFAEVDTTWQATIEETEAIERNGSWELVDLPCGHQLIGMHWIFKLKKNEADTMIKHKVRLIAKGYVQNLGIDFDEAFAPVAGMEFVRLLLSLATLEGWLIHHMYIKSLFLNGKLEEVYVLQPLGFTIPRQEGKKIATLGSISNSPPMLGMCALMLH